MVALPSVRAVKPSGTCLQDELTSVLYVGTILIHSTSQTLHQAHREERVAAQRHPPKGHTPAAPPPVATDFHPNYNRNQGPPRQRHRVQAFDMFKCTGETRSPARRALSYFVGAGSPFAGGTASVMVRRCCGHAGRCNATPAGRLCPLRMSCLAIASGACVLLQLGPATATLATRGVVEPRPRMLHLALRMPRSRFRMPHARQRHCMCCNTHAPAQLRKE